MSDDRHASQARMLANRLAKNEARLGPWLRQQRLTCYRLYDRDIPEIPLAIDMLEGTAVLYDSRLREQDGPHAEAWLAAMCDVISRTAGVAAADMVIKRRQPMKDRRAAGRQYQRIEAPPRWKLAYEGGHAFWLNLANYLDTGLFLDHRVTRAVVAEEARDKALLNLFCYTGAFSVYAGCRGAKRTYSVDMSNTYLEWAERNFRENGLNAGAHRLLRADVLAWLQTPPSETFDLAIVDPPTFSNSKKMAQAFDVLRDHPALLRAVFRRINPGGVVWFSTNHRRFQIAPELHEEFRIVDMTAKTTPPDFSHSRPHASYRLIRR